MAERHDGTCHPTRETPVPPPSSLCPQCQTVEVEATHRTRNGMDEILYACRSGHTWMVYWAVTA